MIGVGRGAVLSGVAAAVATGRASDGKEARQRQRPRHRREQRAPRSDRYGHTARRIARRCQPTSSTLRDALRHVFQLELQELDDLGEFFSIFFVHLHEATVSGQDDLER
jgi:hypothetical protein